jgi:heat shock protein HspQ
MGDDDLRSEDRAHFADDSHSARFGVGELIQHKLFGYRGVVVDVDATFEGSDEWYEGMARSRPPKDQPWYHVLPHEAEHTTYVAERNLEAEASLQPIKHPLLSQCFDDFRDGRYVVARHVN